MAWLLILCLSWYGGCEYRGGVTMLLVTEFQCKAASTALGPPEAGKIRAVCISPTGEVIK